MNNTGLSIAAFALIGVAQFKEAMDSILGMLAMLDEKPLRAMGESSLNKDMNAMNEKLQHHLSDEDICTLHKNQLTTKISLQKLSDIDALDIALQGGLDVSVYTMQEKQAKRSIVLENLYSKLAHVSLELSLLFLRLSWCA